MSRQRIAASRASEILQNLPSDCSDSSESEIEPVVNAALACVPAVEFDESDRDDEAGDQVTHSVMQGVPGLIHGRAGQSGERLLCHLLLRVACNLTLCRDFSLHLHHIPQFVSILTARFHRSGYYLMNQC